MSAPERRASRAPHQQLREAVLLIDNLHETGRHRLAREEGEAAVTAARRAWLEGEKRQRSCACCSASSSITSDRMTCRTVRTRRTDRLIGRVEAQG
jgi:hypothetical protein